ncbi:MAG TPA: hypothetical protein VFU69_10350 [Ktedonobacterales bacterium]|nr:hypothetical protein [Ktedonobacterales bacterium]
MSAVALAFDDLDDFDWLAPVPQLFTRCAARVFWPADRRYRPLLLATRLTRDLKMLIERLPRELGPLLRERFKPTRGPLVWETPPALPTNLRQPYAQAFLTDRTDEGVCAEITLTAGFIERLLNAPEGMVGGLTHNYLLVMQLVRLRQLWAEVERRAWADAPLAVFGRALG